MIAAVRTASGTYVVDLEAEEVIGAGDDFEPLRVTVELPRVVAAAASGATVVAVVDRRPPLAISNDAGRTWREAGGGLPAGFAVAIDDDNPDLMLFAGAQPPLPVGERRHLLARARAGAAGDRGGPAVLPLEPCPKEACSLRLSGTRRARRRRREPPTSTRSICSGCARPRGRRASTAGRSRRPATPRPLRRIRCGRDARGGCRAVRTPSRSRDPQRRRSPARTSVSSSASPNRRSS